MNTVELYILSIFDLVMIYVLMTKVFKHKFEKLIYSVIAIVIGAILTLLIGQLVDHDVMTRALIMIFILIYFYIILMKNRIKILDYLTGTVLIYIMLYSIQIIVILVLTFAFKDFDFSFRYGLIAQATALLGASFLTHYFDVNKLFLYLSHRNIWLKSTMITSLVLYLMLSMLWDAGVGGFLDSIIIVGVTLLVIILVNTLVIKVSVSDKKTKDQLKIYETYLPIIDDIIDEIKVKQHDYHNQIQTISLLKEALEDKDYEPYVTDVGKKDIWDQLILLDNKILMAFLYSKYREALSLDITLSFEFKTYLIKSNYTDYELVDMIGILIDNAIEAASVTEMKHVEVKFEHRDGMNRCVVGNSVTAFSMADVPKMFDFYQSTKGEGRGIGLYKLKNYLDREKGTINVFYDTQTQLIYVEIIFH